MAEFDAAGKLKVQTPFGDLGDDGRVALWSHHDKKLIRAWPVDAREMIQREQASIPTDEQLASATAKKPAPPAAPPSSPPATGNDKDKK